MPRQARDKRNTRDAVTRKGGGGRCCDVHGCSCNVPTEEVRRCESGLALDRTDRLDALAGGQDCAEIRRAIRQKTPPRVAFRIFRNEKRPFKTTINLAPFNSNVEDSSEIAHVCICIFRDTGGDLIKCACKGVPWCEKRHLFLSGFPMFVPSLSWQNDRFDL